MWFRFSVFPVFALGVISGACSTSVDTEKFAQKDAKYTVEKHEKLKGKAVRSNQPIVNYSRSGKPYYHLAYQLKTEDLIQLEELSKQEFEQNGGQFELRIDKTGFPVPAPNCQSILIVRMPWTPPGSNLTKKYSLYQNLQDLQRGKSEELKIVLELNPYVKESEEGLALTQCNVFFRHAKSDYVAHTNRLN